MLIPVCIGLGWLLCSVLSYLIFRYDYRSRDLPWTICDRACTLKVSVLGPIALLISIVVYNTDREGSDKLAKW